MCGQVIFDKINLSHSFAFSLILIPAPDLRTRVSTIYLIAWTGIQRVIRLLKLHTLFLNFQDQRYKNYTHTRPRAEISLKFRNLSRRDRNSSRCNYFYKEQFINKTKVCRNYCMFIESISS